MYGLVLEGGGSKGSYEVGACRALEEMGIEFACVAGTSVGALNGAMVVQGDLKKAYDIWFNIDPSKVFNFSIEELENINQHLYAGEGFYAVLRRIRKIIAERGLDITPLVKQVTEHIDEKKIRNAAADFGIVTVDLTNRRPLEIYKEDIPFGKLAEYLIASASFPGFKLKNIDGNLFIDGGIYNTLPINLASDKGCTDIITVRTYGFGRRKKIDTTGLNIIEIAPAESLGPILDFGNERARRNLKMGYYDAVKAIKGLSGRNYYINSVEDEKYFIQYLTGLNEEKINKVGKLFGLERKAGARMLLEAIIPKIADLLNISRNATYKEISIALIETIAQSCGVDRYNVYSFNEILEEIFNKRKPFKEEFIREIPGFIRRMDVISKIIRDRIIGAIANELFEDMIITKAS